MSVAPSTIDSPRPRTCRGEVPAVGSRKPAGSSKSRGITFLVAVVAAATLGAAVPPHAQSAPPTNLTIPSVSGMVQVPNALTAGNGTWSGHPLGMYTYQWQRCDASGANCQDVSSATTKVHVLTSADIGGTVRVGVTARDLADATTSAYSGATPEVLDRYEVAVVGDQPIAYWRLGEASGSLSAGDSSNNGKLLMYTGGVRLGVPGALSGDTNTAAEFDGIDDYLTGPLVTTQTTGLTLEAWVLRTALKSALVIYNVIPATTDLGS